MTDISSSCIIHLEADVKMTKSSQKSNHMRGLTDGRSDQISTRSLNLCKFRKPSYVSNYQFVYSQIFTLTLICVALNEHLPRVSKHKAESNHLQNNHDSSEVKTISTFFSYANAHVVLTRDDRGQNLVLTGEDGKNEDGEGDQLVIAGDNMGGGGGGGQDTRMIMQDAANREGDVVMNGRSMIIPGEDGHIVLADSRQQDGGGGGGGGGFPRHMSPMGPNPLMMWMPFMGPRLAYRMMMPYMG